MNTLEIKLKNGKPVFSWCNDMEKGAIDQIEIIAKLPFVEHIAIMPDCHQGMSCPIGGVVACDGVIVPVFVGVDIGCGMGAIKTTLKSSDLTKEKKEELLHSFKRGIPLGFSHNSSQRIRELKQAYGQQYKYYSEEKNKIKECCQVLIDPEAAFFEQLGTLGSGNHFCELQADEEENVWAMIHSGSRNIGKQICDYFNDRARALNKIWYSETTEDIPFLPTCTTEGKEYVEWMNFALNFAFLNRQVMMEEVKKDIEYAFKNKHIQFDKLINIHHNYAVLENHFNKNWWIHRKGATLAREGTIGIIPGSMGTASYITKGLGHNRSLNSCSHGAGRLMGRNEFNSRFNTEEGVKSVKDSLKDVIHLPFQKETTRKGKETGFLDMSEAPAAYKNIEDVMSSQADLVTPIVQLRPLICLKG